MRSAFVPKDGAEQIPVTFAGGGGWGLFTSASLPFNRIRLRSHVNLTHFQKSKNCLKFWENPNLMFNRFRNHWFRSNMCTYILNFSSCIRWCDTDRALCLVRVECKPSCYELLALLNMGYYNLSYRSLHTWTRNSAQLFPVAWVPSFNLRMLI